MKKAVVWLIVIAALAGGGYYARAWMNSRESSAAPSFISKLVRRTDLISTIEATGTIEPEDLVDVGAQIAGRIVEFGKDTNGRTVDYGSQVRQGMLLAKLDDRTYKANLTQAEAELRSAEANLEKSKADLKQLQAKVDQAERDWSRAKKLGPSDAMAQSSYDSYKSAYEVAAANYQVGVATITQNEASIRQAQASVDIANENLGYCIINSPVTGVIITRRVNIGQTVVASQTAPSLFLIAKDLRNVQIWVSVNEADIGGIYPGQPVAFTVDAFAGEKFHGVVKKVRLNATMTSNVVTYTVEVSTPNEDSRLLPYLTARVAFETARADKALVAPNTALKFTPQEGAVDDGAATAARTASPVVWQRVWDEATSQTSLTHAGQSLTPLTDGQLWTLRNGQPVAVKVKVGISDGVDTVVTGDGVREGMPVLTGLRAQGAAGGDAGGAQAAASGGQQAAKNPFLPQFPRRNRNQRSGSGGPPPPPR